MSYCIYLRKSRADSADENEMETLSRHERTLIELAKTKKLHVVKTFREVVSGESIAARPQMQEMLAEVEQGIYEGVICIEIERLGRGNPIDQGLISQTFQYSNTKIVTLNKTYDLNNEMDDEYSEFGLFMSRREYKTINRRLQRGRLTSINEGKYVGSVPPYGYERFKLKKGYSLKINDEESTVVKLIFNLFINENMGTSLIANHLNDLKIIPRKERNWVFHTIRSILTNPVYIGKIRYNHRKVVKKVENNIVSSSRPINDDYILVKGLHDPIIDETTFNRVQQILQQNSLPKVKKETTLQNTLANIVKCGMCGRVMIRRPYPNREAAIICTSKQCKNVASDLSLVESILIIRLELWLKEYKLKIENASVNQSNEDFKKKAIKKLEAELEKLVKQENKLCDLLEQEVYTIEKYNERNEILLESKKKIISDINTLTESLNNSSETKEKIQRYESILDVYKNTNDIELKNSILKEILMKVEYTKEKSGRWGNPSDFKLKLYPRI